MNKKMKKEWVKWLRSGAYKKGRLIACSVDRKCHGEDLFCAMGVLMDLAAYEIDAYWFPTLWGDYTLKKTDKDGLYFIKTYGSREIGRKYGIKKKDHDRIIVMNDQQNASFDEIADWIEKNL